ncbi:hypothetical protein CRUP_002794, partial [Coryphaenoides rupestris]
MDAMPCPGTELDPPESWGTVPLNGRAQNLTEMYWETQGLLQQQNAVRHRMQEQITASLSPLEHQQPPRVQAPSIWLHDTDGNQQQLGYFHPDLPSTANTTAPSLILDNEEPPLHSDGERAESNIQTLMERAAYKQVSSSDTHINNTGEDYVQMPLNIFESLSDQDECVTPELAVFKRLSQEVELLRGQNKALHQHNQEMLNQLTEADREITRLKAHLGLLPEVERTSQARVAVLEMELNSRIRELLEARSLSASLERRLSEAESQASQLGTTTPLDVPGDAVESGVEVDTTTAGCGGKEYLLRCFEATEAKLMDLERKLHQSEQSCSELQCRNVEVEEAVRTCGQRAVEAEAEVSRLSAELEEAKSREGQKIPNCTRLGNENGELRATVSLVKELEKASAACKPVSTNPQGQDQALRIWLQDIKAHLATLGDYDPEGDREETGAGTDTLAVTPAEQELSIPDGTQPMDRPEETGPSLQDSRESPDPEVNVEMSNHSGDAGLAEEKEGEEEEEEEVEACERGLASMEESQQRLLEGIQLHHQGELERLLTDRDQLLEEETAAAVTAIQSIKRAYQLQLERHAEETQQSNISSDNTHLQETQQQQHREELEVLVQQVSLQHQETSLLGQALQAERTALSRCQLENRALRARNQELSLLAAEGRLCSSSQWGLGGEVFQLEISLRVAESELQWLRQEVTGLQEDMLHAHR